MSDSKRVYGTGIVGEVGYFKFAHILTEKNVRLLVERKIAIAKHFARREVV